MRLDFVVDIPKCFVDERKQFRVIHFFLVVHLLSSLSVGLRVESRPVDVNDLGDASLDGASVICGKGLVERLIRREDLSGVLRDKGTLVADMERSLEIPVKKVDCCLSWNVGKGHVVEDDAVMFGSIETPEVVHVGHNEWVLEAMDGPLGLPSVCRTIEVYDS